MSFIFNLIGGVRGIILIAIIVALGGYAFSLRQGVSRLEKSREEVVQQRDEAARQRDLALTANRTNTETIEQLQAERDNIQTALNNLQEQRARDREVISSLSARIRAQAQNPANQVMLSPVLKDIVDGIQAERAKRTAPR